MGSCLNPQITVATSTTINRVNSVRDIDCSIDVDHLVLVQGISNISDDLSKLGPESATLIYLEGRGVARSRNQAIKECKTEFLIFSDDDARLVGPGICKVLLEFQRSPEVDFLLLRSVDEGGNPRKRYPRSGKSASRFNTGRYGTIEIAIRVDKVRRSGSLFNVHFGAGTDLPLGDEYLFIVEMLKRGLKGRHSDSVISVHDIESSGNSQTPLAIRSRRQVFQIVFPYAHHFLYPLWHFRRRLRKAVTNSLTVR